MSLSTAKRKTDPYAAPALEKGLDILELLADEPNGLTQSQIAEKLDRSNPEIFRMLLCLQRRGYLRRVSPGETFELSAKLFELSHRHPPTRSLLDSALPILRSLAADAQQSCHLAIEYEQQLLIIASVEGPGPRTFAVRVGARFDMHQTASGLVLLAWRNDDPKHDRIRRRGYEQHRSRTVHGVIDVSYPVRDSRGEVIAAMTIPYLASRDKNVASVDHARDALARAASKLSHMMGHTP
jgi:DNA-binding IclR family transcriptional regulator